MHLQPQKSLKTSCISTCIRFRRKGNFTETQFIIGEKIGFKEFYTSSGGDTGIMD